MTVCNMSIEGGARAGNGRARRHDFAYLAGRARARRAPPGIARWSAGAELADRRRRAFDASSRIDATALEPMITWGTNPGTGIGITQPVPDPMPIADSRSARGAREGASSTWGCGRGSRSSATRSTSCSSAAARTPGSPICAPRRRSSRPPGRAERAHAGRARHRRRSRRRRRRKASTRSSATPAPSGASPAARCASR